MKKVFQYLKRKNEFVISQRVLMLKFIPTIFQQFIQFLRKKNEFTFVILLIVLIWHFMPIIFQKFDPQAGEFSIEILYIPLIAGIYFFIALLFVWAYMALVWPKGYKMLDEIFKNDSNMRLWEKVKVLLVLFSCLVFLFAISLLAVTGISAIM